MCFDGSTIYYISLDTDGVYRVSVSGGEPEKIVDHSVSDLVLAGDYLYYNDLKDGYLEAYSLKTGATVVVSPFLMDYYHPRADGVVGALTGDGKLIRYDPSTGVTYALSDKQVAYVCIANEKIFYWDFLKFYATNLDGKGAIAL